MGSGHREESPAWASGLTVEGAKEKGEVEVWRTGWQW